MIMRLSSQTFCLLLFLGIVPAAPQNPSTPGNQACPFISVSCPPHFEYGDPVTFTASVAGGDSNVKPAYSWEVSAGRIIEGQGSSSIKVDTTGLDGQAPTGTVTISGFDLACSATASCSLIVEHLPNSIKFDSYGILQTQEEIARLTAFANHLQDQPGTQGYLLVYDGRRGRSGEAKRTAARSQEYLIKTHGIDAARIVTVDSGLKEDLTIDLWVVPTGANPPRAEPTVDPGGGKIIPTPRKRSTKHN